MLYHKTNPGYNGSSGPRGKKAAWVASEAGHAEAMRKVGERQQAYWRRKREERLAGRSA